MNVFISSVMRETWEERNEAKNMLEYYGHVPILKANYERGPQAGRETVYHEEPTRILIESCECFLMIPKFIYGLTATSGYSIAHEELQLARKMIKQGIVFGPPNDKIKNAEKSQEQLLIELSAYLSNSYITYEGIDEFKNRLKDVLQNEIDKHTTPLRPNKVLLSHSTVDKGFVENLASDPLLMALKSGMINTIFRLVTVS